MANRKNSIRLEAGSEDQKDRTDLSEYFVALKDNSILDELEADQEELERQRGRESNLLNTNAK